MKKLTIGSAVYDDFEGVYFTYQSLRLNNQDILEDLEFIIIDNNPESEEGKATKEFYANVGIKHIPYTEKRSTAVRNEIFKNASAEFCMSIDCHVLFEADTIKKLIEFFENHADSQDLYHGPMLYDIIKGHDAVSKMDPVWRDNMFGVWACDKRGEDPEGKPFEIEMHGMGIFACKTDEWLGFNEDFIGFGGEEGYIHKKFQQAGRKIWCLPFLRWVHRFQRPLGVKYPCIVEERIRNYFIGHHELGLDTQEIIDHFNETFPEVDSQQILDDLKLGKPPKTPRAPKALPAAPQKDGKIVTQRDIPQKLRKIKIWKDSNVEFTEASPIKYLKYEILGSYDGHAAIKRLLVYPNNPEKASIEKITSQREGYEASLILSQEKAWMTAKDQKGQFPHELVVNFNEVVWVEKISTLAKTGSREGLPTEFKIYCSLDGEEWDEISHVDLLEESPSVLLPQ